MKEHRIKCEMIQDILPLYIDGLTSQITNQEIEEHIAECNICKEILNCMREPEVIEAPLEEKEKIDILKVTKKKNRKHVIVSVLLICSALILGFLAKIFIIGDKVREDSVLCTVKKVDDTFYINASLADSGLGFVKTQVLEGSNFLRIELRTALVSSLTSGEYETEYTIKNPEENPILRVYIGDRIVWEEGHEIPRKVFELYETRHAYVGDVSANSATAEAIQMSDLLGSFTHELNGKTWTIILNEVVSTEYEAAVEEKMKSYACVFMALIGNLDVVRFEYMTETGKQICAFNTDDALVAAGGDIKNSVQSAKDLLMLLRKFNLENPSLDTYETVITPVHITANPDLQINRMVLYYFLNGKEYATVGYGTAEGDSLESEEEYKFQFPKIEWKLDSLDQYSVELSMDIFTVDGTVYHVQKTDEMPFELNGIYKFELLGNEESGFRLELKK